MLLGIDLKISRILNMFFSTLYTIHPLDIYSVYYPIIYILL